ncbi:MAG TPA: response regulator [Aggregatilinea sp.]|jgi:CheY-like chemotaxis protein|uniref:response regulator n=1 Tax=Aggregatilinea sp. TaxID=2806333 RepID=UPI002B5879AA|nr:response regulator [Aggregatilinea sp.]HML23710.1 response regulator [Aggregatilinea sp.]
MSDGDPIRPASTPTSQPPQIDQAVVTLSALVVDDEPANCDFCVRLLQQTKLNVKGASSGQEALDLSKAMDNLALIVIDHRLPDMSGVELLAQMRTRFPHAMIIMATMHDERSLMDEAFKTGCDVFLVKPHGFMELYKRLKTTPPGGGDTHEKIIIDQYGPRPYHQPGAPA